jgi:chaperonin GroES
MTTLQPINDNIIIKLPAVEKELKTNSGIVLATTSAGQPKPDQGEIIAVGQGRLTADGKLIPLTVEVGQTIIFNRFAGSEIAVGEDRYLILKETDILVIVK